ncbi:MAG: hypothetical protein QW474_01110 [Candidatus Aenigmatarchaeota archaeon]
MANPFERIEGIELNKEYKKFSYENVRFNFYEIAPIQKKIFMLTPDNVNIAISHITYTMGCMDLSANGYIQLILSKLDNPNVYAITQNNSQILLDVMCGATAFVNDKFDFTKPYVLNRGEYIFGFLYSNIPSEILGKVNIYFIPLFD